jgi:hypothetical protein
MPDRTSGSDRVERRAFLAGLAAGAGGLAASGGSVAREPAGDGYVLEQGDRCVSITPLSGDETAESFYDYRAPFTDPSGQGYSSYGTTDLQRPETSVLFLYDGPDGLSLIVVHDKYGDDTNGGAVTLRFEGVDGGEWAIGDDDYDAPSNYDAFERTEDGWRVDWTWGAGRSDGGVYRPLSEAFDVTIRPGFNEGAALYGEYYDGELTDWQVLSGDRDDPDRVSLSLDEPVTVRTGSCPDGGVGVAGGEKEEDEDDDRDDDITVEAEILPDRVNPRSRGTLPVLVRSTDDFDATTIDPESIELGPDEATPEAWSRTVGDDGRTHLLLTFRLPETGIGWDTEEAELEGETSDGEIEVEGAADVRLVPNGRAEEEDDVRERDDQDEEADDDDDDDDRDGDDDEDTDDSRRGPPGGSPPGRGGSDDGNPGKGPGENPGRGTGPGN